MISACTSAGTDHPRSRGEYRFVTEPSEALVGSSPLSRGIRPRRNLIHPSPGIIPALAGNTFAVAGPGQRCWDHPRSRGEYGLVAGAVWVVWGSSPLSRGILGGAIEAYQTAGIIPALAGNTGPGFERLGCIGDHPRSRGEYLGPSEASAPMAGSSPLSRGIPAGSYGCSGCFGIIPALAGNTTLAKMASVSVRDHPRSRGEYEGVSGHGRKHEGSSPLSRGIQPRGEQPRKLGRIIPALAGNTIRLCLSRLSR